MKNKIGVLLLSVIVLWSCGEKIKTDGVINIVPKPRKEVLIDGEFTVKSSTPIVIATNVEDMDYVVAGLNDIVEPMFGRELKSVKSDEIIEGSISFVNDPLMSKEEYRLDINSNGVVVKSSTAQGAFYAVQTIRQIIPFEAFVSSKVQSFELPTCIIKDKPSFEYRGVMLDVCRHFYQVDEVKKIIDMLVMHKINTLHWHLTEDQGWRIEIKKYPKLTEIGSIRKETKLGHYEDKTAGYDGVPYGGYYTQEEIKEVVQYATERFVEVIPEIELPGHAVAALTAYPHLGCRGEGYEVRTTWGVSEDVYCVGKDSTFEFLEDVLNEVIELFPAKYIHIGGDECPKVEWKKCPDCQARIKNEKLRDENHLQGYTTKRIEEFLAKHDRKLIGWDEILEGGVTPNATIMSWRGTQGGIAAAKQGNHVIMTPGSHCYFDKYQMEDTSNELMAIGGYIPLEMVYSFDPHAQLNKQEQACIIGLQANIWTEYIKTLSHLEYMVLPRLSAIAEVGWSYENRNYEDYMNRMNSFVKFYDHYGYNYCRNEFVDDIK